MRGKDCAAIMAAVAASGALTMAAMVRGGGIGSAPSFELLDLAFMGFATLGAALAGAVCAPLLKHSKGWVAALGALVATALGASLGGAGFISIADPALAAGLIFGPVAVVPTIFTDAVVFAVWALAMVGVRILSVWLRRRAAQS